MQRTFVILTDAIDEDNDRFILAGLRIKDHSKIFVTDNFDNTKVIGFASVEVSDKEIKATCEIPTEYEHRFGAIGFNEIESRTDNGIRVIEKCTLQQIGLCSNKNLDPTIKRINEY